MQPSVLSPAAVALSMVAPRGEAHQRDCSLLAELDGVVWARPETETWGSPSREGLAAEERQKYAADWINGSRGRRGGTAAEDISSNLVLSSLGVVGVCVVQTSDPPAKSVVRDRNCFSMVCGKPELARDYCFIREKDVSTNHPTTSHLI
jgi:hypothetical protein